MNVFLSHHTISGSVMDLDDRRLIKQILEVVVLMGDSKGYRNHPVKVFYQNDKKFLAHYGYTCCAEYFYRFNKIHKLYQVFTDYIVNQDCYDPLINWWTRGLYASGAKNSPECVRETCPASVVTLFRKKLAGKWKTDKIPPKWTNREPPEWYNKEET